MSISKVIIMVVLPLFSYCVTSHIPFPLNNWPVL